DRAKLKELTESLLLQTSDLMNTLLQDKNVSADQVDQVLLAGGSTKLMMVREMLQLKFPGKVNTSIDPDLCVAQGAAWMGDLISEGAKAASVSAAKGDTGAAAKAVAKFLDHIVDVCSHALGVAAINAQDERKIFPLIPKDAKLPCEGKDTFYTRSD